MINQNALSRIHNPSIYVANRVVELLVKRVSISESDPSHHHPHPSHSNSPVPPSHTSPSFSSSIYHRNLRRRNGSNALPPPPTTIRPLAHTSDSCSVLEIHTNLQPTSTSPVNNSTIRACNRALAEISIIPATRIIECLLQKLILGAGIINTKGDGTP